MTNEEESTKEKPILNRFTVTDSLIIASFPIIAFCFTFIYMSGYFNYFMLPTSLIKLSLVDVFGIGGRLIVYLLIAFISLDLIYGLLPERSRGSLSIKQRFAVFAPIFLFSLPTFIFYDWGSAANFYSVVLSIVVIILFAPTLFYRKSPGSYLERMEAMDNEFKGKNPVLPPLFNETINFIGRKLFTVIIYVLLFIYLIYNAGYSSARLTKEFRVTNTQPEAVVLYLSGEYIIYSPFDRSTGEVKSEICVVNLLDDPGLSLKLENLGTLHMSK